MPKYKNYKKLILQYKKIFIELQKDTNYLQNLSFCEFEYLEYEDFYINLHKGKILDKANSWLNGKGPYCFKYFNCKKEDLIKNYEFNIECLKSIFKSDDDFMLYLKSFGIILSGCNAIKGNAIYLYGKPNTGKTLISETFLINIFGEKNCFTQNMFTKTYYYFK